MDIYRRGSSWKLYAMVIGVLIMVVLVIAYSSFLASNLREVEHDRVQLLAKAYEEIANITDETQDRDLDPAFGYHRTK